MQYSWQGNHQLYGVCIWFWSTLDVRCTYVGLARTIYIRFMYCIFGREITKYTVIYGAYIRFWPTLYIQYFWQRTRKMQGHIRCIYTVLANPTYQGVRLCPIHAPAGCETHYQRSLFYPCLAACQHHGALSHTCPSWLCNALPAQPFLSLLSCLPAPWCSVPYMPLLIV